MNDELFRPRGLYCLVMAYDTNSRIDQTPLDQGIGPGPFLPPAFDEQSPSSREKIRSNDGVAGASSFPVPAELIYFDAVDSPPGRGDAESDDSEGRNAKAGGSSFTNSLIKRAAAYNARQDLKSQVKFVRQASCYHQRQSLGPYLNNSTDVISYTACSKERIQRA